MHNTRTIIIKELTYSFSNNSIAHTMVSVEINTGYQSCLYLYTSAHAQVHIHVSILFSKIIITKDVRTG